MTDRGIFKVLGRSETGGGGGGSSGRLEELLATLIQVFQTKSLNISLPALNPQIHMPELLAPPPRITVEAPVIHLPAPTVTVHVDALVAPIIWAALMISLAVLASACLLCFMK